LKRSRRTCRRRSAGNRRGDAVLPRSSSNDLCACYAMPSAEYGQQLRDARRPAITDLLARLSGVRRNGEGWTARCPAHDDQHNSLSIHHRDGRWLVKCHAGCEWTSIRDALGLMTADLLDNGKQGGDRRNPGDNSATVQPSADTSRITPPLPRDPASIEAGPVGFDSRSVCDGKKAAA
jgi:hypothetical protein